MPRINYMAPDLYYDVLGTSDTYGTSEISFEWERTGTQVPKM